MKTFIFFICTDHDGFWPVGACSVVLAPSETLARELLEQALRTRGLDATKPFTLTEIGVGAHILNDGDY